MRSIPLCMLAPRHRRLGLRCSSSASSSRLLIVTRCSPPLSLGLSAVPYFPSLSKMHLKLLRCRRGCCDTSPLFPPPARLWKRIDRLSAIPYMKFLNPVRCASLGPEWVDVRGEGPHHADATVFISGAGWKKPWPESPPPPCPVVQHHNLSFSACLSLSGRTTIDTYSYHQPGTFGNCNSNPTRYRVLGNTTGSKVEEEREITVCEWKISDPRDTVSPPVKSAAISFC
jgi:hypothetical protein